VLSFLESGLILNLFNMNEVTGSLSRECERRLTNLYTEHHKWLLQASYKVTKSKLEAEDLVSELYEWLHKKKNPKLFWGDSYNIMYCSKYLKCRYLNKTKKLNRTTYVETIFDSNEEDIEYDTENDLLIQASFDNVMAELKRLESTKMWASSKIFQLYFFSDKTLDKVAADIKISKSTTYLAVKKIKEHLNQLLDSPFNDIR
jgi:RNA polymerase sigma factor (sigma-70 family)